MGFEPMNTGFADQRVSHFATGASTPSRITRNGECHRRLIQVGQSSADTASPSCIPEKSCLLLRSRPLP
jgi:hypothetical protein